MTTTTYYVSDQVGSARAEVSFGSWPLWWGSFDPYGNETYANGTPNNFKFTGKERDTETGDDNFGARYYSSTLMRFMSPDPGWQMASDPANPLSWNQYEYVMGNPLSFIDPAGLQASSANPDNNGGNTNCYSDGNNNFGCEDGSNPPPPLPPANPMPIPIAVFPIFGGGKNSSQTTQQNNAAPSKVGCSTVLPNGRTLGQYINQGRAQLQAVIDRQNEIAASGGDINPFAVAATFGSIARDYGQIDFKNGAAGKRVLATNLGQAGNFAYYAIGSGYISPGLLDFGASVYAVAATVPYPRHSGKPFSTIGNGPMLIDDSAASVRSAGLSTPGCPQ